MTWRQNIFWHFLQCVVPEWSTIMCSSQFRWTSVIISFIYYIYIHVCVFYVLSWYSSKMTSLSRHRLSNVPFTLSSATLRMAILSFSSVSRRKYTCDPICSIGSASHNSTYIPTRPVYNVTNVTKYVSNIKYSGLYSRLNGHSNQSFKLIDGS